MNVKLLRKVKKHILAEPKRLVMWTWRIYKTEDDDKFVSDGYGQYRKLIPFAECGTAACIAGWTCLLSGKKLGGNIESSARNLLDVGIESDRLFLATHWPEKFRTKYWRAKSQKTRAKIAAERIEHFIKTKGME